MPREALKCKAFGKVARVCRGGAKAEAAAAEMAPSLLYAVTHAADGSVELLLFRGRSLSLSPAAAQALAALLVSAPSRAAK